MMCAKSSIQFQPDISKYASEILPLLFQYLLQVSQDPEKHSKGLTRSYYALEMFCENLGRILKYIFELPHEKTNNLLFAKPKAQISFAVTAKLMKQ